MAQETLVTTATTRNNPTVSASVSGGMITQVNDVSYYTTSGRWSNVMSSDWKVDTKLPATSVQISIETDLTDLALQDSNMHIEADVTPVDDTEDAGYHSA